MLFPLSAGLVFIAHKYNSKQNIDITDLFIGYKQNTINSKLQAIWVTKPTIITREFVLQLLNWIDAKQFIWEDYELFIDNQIILLDDRDVLLTKLDELRINTNNLVVETIKLFNDIYKKGRYTEQRGKKIVNLIELFKEKLLNENLLPYFAVDPYCLYSEGNELLECQVKKVLVKDIPEEYMPTNESYFYE